MTNINLVFDGNLDDADIIAVPDEIVSIIEEIGAEFLRWVSTAEDSDYWTIIDGRRCVVAETNGFIKWINSCYCNETEKACIVARNIKFCPDYRIIEF